MKTVSSFPRQEHTQKRRGLPNYRDEELGKNICSCGMFMKWVEPTDFWQFNCSDGTIRGMLFM